MIRSLSRSLGNRNLSVYNAGSAIAINTMTNLFPIVMSISIVITPSIISPTHQGIAHAQHSSDGWSNLMRQAEDLESKDKYSEAETIYRQILAQPRPDSLNDFMYYYIQTSFGQILQTQGKFTEAIAVLQKVINSNATDSETHNRASQILTRVLESQQNAAQLVARGLQEIRLNSQRGYFELAKGLAAQGQLINGFTFLETQLGHPLTLESTLELARAANSQGVEGSISGSGYRSRSSVRQDAVSLYRQLVRRYPDNQIARAEFIDILSLSGQKEELIAIYREEIRINPTEELYRLLVRELQENDQLNKAIAAYEQLLRREGRFTNPSTYMHFGDLLVESKKIERALQIYLKGIQAFPKDRTGNPRCRGLYRTSYDRLVETLASQNRLSQILPLLEKSFPNPPAEAYASLALSLAYQDQFARRQSAVNQSEPPYQQQAEAVNQRLQERYPDAKNWQGDVKTWQDGCGGHY
jgi:tetratricopeptide (TPR) repeat protein